MLQRLSDSKCIHRIGEREHWALTRRTQRFRVELDGLERRMSTLPFPGSAEKGCMIPVLAESPTVAVRFDGARDGDVKPESFPGELLAVVV